FSASTSSMVLFVPLGLISDRPAVSMTWLTGSSMYCQVSPSPGLLPSFHGPLMLSPLDILKYVLLYLGSPCITPGGKLGLIVSSAASNIWKWAISLVIRNFRVSFT